MDIIDLYKNLLANAGMEADADGFVSLRLIEDIKEPVTIDDKRLVIPTQKQQATPNLGNRVVFHPLYESLLRGESDVVSRFRDGINTRLNLAFSYVGICLLTLATSPAQHAHMTPEQTLFLDHVKDADERTVTAFKKITDAMALGDADKCFVHLFIKRAGKLKGEVVQRLGVVSFPLYEELVRAINDKDDNAVFGVKMRKVDREVIMNLVKFLVPGVEKPDFYNRGSNSTVAPTMDALMHTTGELGVVINDLVALFGENFIPAGQQMSFPMDWVEDFQDLNALLPKIRMIPMQPGNEGRLAQVGNPANQIPVEKEAPWEGEASPEVKAVVTNDNGQQAAPGTRLFNLRELTQPQQQQQQRPVYPPNNLGGGFAGYQQRGQAGFGQPQQPREVIVTEHGIDVRSLLGTPTSSYGGSPYGSPAQPQRPQHVPLWARTGLPGYSNGYGNGGGGFSNV